MTRTKRSKGARSPGRGFSIGQALAAGTAGMLMVLGLAGAWGWTAAAEAHDVGAPSDDPVVLRAQLGIIYAQNGQVDGARQEFVKLLEIPRGRAIALTNLGNLAFITGELDEALESYQQAAALDEDDAGILLNLGLAFKFLGETEEAEKSFATAVEMAGGVDKASYLLGLYTADDSGRGKVSRMTSDELRQMLVRADTRVPTKDKKTAKQAKPKVTTRPGGSRAAEAVGEQNLYWKDR